MGFLRRLIGGGGDASDAEATSPDEPPRDAAPIETEASSAEPTPGLLGDLPWVPAARVASLAAVLSAPVLARFLGVTPARLHAWIAETEPMPEMAIGRLAFLEDLTGRLAGRHDELGVRRWFERPRAKLGGRAPSDLLSADWSPGDPALVDSLVRLTATGTAPAR